VFHLPAYELGILFTLAGYYLRAKSQYASAGDYIIRAIRTLSAALGPEDPIIMKTRHCLVHICHGADRYEEAEDIFRVLISYYSYNTGGGHAQVFIVSSHLSNMLRVQKRRGEAEEHALRAVLGLEAVHSVDVKHLLNSKRTLSTILGERGHKEESSKI